MARNILVGSDITIQEPSEEILKWCKKEMTIDNPEYDKKFRMGLWLGNTPQRLQLYTMRGSDIVLPFGALHLLPQEMTKDYLFTSLFTPPKFVSYGTDPVPLYDYQRVAVANVHDAKFGILQSAAGSGKTQMGIALIKLFGRRALWVTHTIDLLEQSKARAEQYIYKELIGTITGGKINASDGVTFATVQTLSAIDLSKWKDYWDVIIVDECHRVCGTPTSLTMFAKVLDSLSARHKIGLSATVHRADGMIKATYSYLGKVVHVVPDEAIADKIMKVGICPVQTPTRISRECMNSDGTLNFTGMTTYLAENRERNAVILQKLIEEKGHSCLILSARIKHLENLMDALPPSMIGDAVMITGKMTSKKAKAERQQAIEDMRTGKKKYLFASYNLAKEGLDIPRLDRLFLATPQKDYAVITQSIGRIARTFEGKDNPICYDFVDDIGYMVRAYKARCTTYRKNHCYWIEEENKC